MRKREIINRLGVFLIAMLFVLFICAIWIDYILIGKLILTDLILILIFWLIDKSKI